MIPLVEFSCHFYVQPKLGKVLCYMCNMLILLFSATSVGEWRWIGLLCGR